MFLDVRIVFISLHELALSDFLRRGLRHVKLFDSLPICNSLACQLLLLFLIHELARMITNHLHSHVFRQLGFVCLIDGLRLKTLLVVLVESQPFQILALFLLPSQLLLLGNERVVVVCVLLELG